MSNGTYIEHTTKRGEFYEVVDASTIGGNRPHDDVVAVSLHSASRWCTPAEAKEFAYAILEVVDAHCKRRGALNDDSRVG